MIYFLIILSVFLQVNSFTPKEGDLLFQDIDCGPLCDAIDEVTVGIDGAKFSHIGLIVNRSGELYVLEAISKGVVYTHLLDFLQRSLDAEGRPKVIVGRVKQEYQQLLPDVVAYASQYQGSPYDTVFRMSNAALYCSELIYQSFKSASNSEFFELLPMTFKSPKTDSVFNTWQEYYDSMGIEIPEGEPGINPGSISRSDRIEIVHVYGNPDGYVPNSEE